MLDPYNFKHGLRPWRVGVWALRAVVGGGSLVGVLAVELVIHVIIISFRQTLNP